MTDIKIPRIGPGRFQWNGGGWFGSSIGSSAWMLVASCFLLAHQQPILASIPLAAFSVVIIVSYVLWSLRDRIDPFPALMILLSLLAIVIPMVWMFLQFQASPTARASMNWPRSPWATVLVFAIVPVTMSWFVIVERIARSSKLSRS